MAAVLGILFGTLFMAAHASQGPKLGLPQMIQCRAQFGYRGVILPLIATGFTYLAFNVVDTIIIKEGLAGIFGWNATLIAVVITPRRHHRGGGREAGSGHGRRGQQGRRRS